MPFRSVLPDSTMKKNGLYRDLCRHKGSVLFGYSSSICDFMNYLEANSLPAEKTGVKVIVCDSDELSIPNKRLLEK